MIATILSNVVLAVRLFVAVPMMSPLDAYVHATVANEQATTRVSPELLLAIAFVESRYDATATSRVERGVRITGRYPSTTPPADLDPHGSLFCGPLQAYASSWSACLAMRDLDTGYKAGVGELEEWLRDRRVHDIAHALAGHGCGNAGAVTGVCNRYPERVLELAQWIERPTVHLRRSNI